MFIILQGKITVTMKQELLHSCPELIDYINETGFLPLLSMGIAGWSAEEVASLPLSANVQFMTVMASAMPYIGRG